MLLNFGRNFETSQHCALERYLRRGVVQFLYSKWNNVKLISYAVDILNISDTFKFSGISKNKQYLNTWLRNKTVYVLTIDWFYVTVAQDSESNIWQYDDV